MWDLVKASMAAFAIVAAMGQSRLLNHQDRMVVTNMAPGLIVAQAVSPTSITIEDRATMWLKEAGCWGIIMVVLYFYRRDFLSEKNYWKDRDTMMIQIVQEDTKSRTQLANNVFENTQVTHSLKDVIRQFDQRGR